MTTDCFLLGLVLALVAVGIGSLIGAATRWGWG